MNRLELFTRYNAELDELIPNEFHDSPKVMLDYFKTLNDSENYIWIDIKKGQSLIGFLIIGFDEVCHPKCDWFISQAYVLPEYREQGYMTTEVNKWLREHHGSYCMYILNENDYAKEFWENRFKTFGYEPYNVKTPKSWYQAKVCTPYTWHKGELKNEEN